MARYEGNALQAYGPSLPADLRDIWHKRYQACHALQEAESVTLPSPGRYSARISDDYALWRWRLELLADALQFPKFSKERGEALKATAAKETTKPNGKPWRPAVSTLEAWLKIVEEQGEQALQRKRRKESAPRVLISRAWDKACPLANDKKAEIAAHMETHVKTLWKEGAPGWKRVNQLASVELLEQCRLAGWDGATLKSCEPGRPFVEKFREFALVALKEKNAKRFFDTQMPRVQRHRNGYKPSDIVIGDVHPMDVAREIDGRTVHARLISWLDVATYDLFVTVVILPPGKGITQADIAASFVDMVQAWGLPKQLRLDNGKEYKWDAMIKGFQALAGLVSAFQAFHVSIMGKGEAAELIDGEQFAAISRARPYNAPAKQIEHVFAIVEYQFFSLMPGWVGGDRMNKRTQLVGQEPKAYRGADDDFAHDIRTCLDLYRNTAQKDGSSPNDKRRKAIEEGWRAVRVSRHDLIFAFSEIRKIKVKTGGLVVEERGIKTWYRADIIVPLIGQTVEIRYAKWAREALFYLDDSGQLHAIPQADAYAQEDGQGAKEQSRLNGLKLAHVQQLKGQTKTLNLLTEAVRVNAELPPAPTLPDGPLITTAEGEAIGDALAAMQLPAPAKLLPGQLRHPTEGHIIDMQPINESGPKPTAIDFDPLRFAPPALEAQKLSRESPAFDPLKALITAKS
ncbi:MAG: hypothetical protein F9K30_00245 [Dechloromonas sp.]|nr:MAG: hypothetical protein F9K30_00245 [Dechloromonas sp.]